MIIPRNKKKSDTSQLLLTGSQINLSLRPMPRNYHKNLIWSTNNKNYPMRRSISAFGFQHQSEDEVVRSQRPLSAGDVDKRATRTSRSSDGKNDDHGDLFELSENTFENILNDYTEHKNYDKQEMDIPYQKDLGMEPGLQTKPPLPPTEAKSTESNADVIGNQNTDAEREAFDEIVALKFQRWFPNAVTAPIPEESEEEENVELLFREQRYQSCEYRCEVMRKNSKHTVDSTTNRNKNSGNKNKVKSENNYSVTVSKKTQFISPTTVNKTKPITSRVTDEKKTVEKNRENNAKLKYSSRNKSPKFKRISFSLDQPKHEESDSRSEQNKELLTKQNQERVSNENNDPLNCEYEKDETENIRKTMISPQQPAGTEMENVTTWMSIHDLPTRSNTPHSKMASPEVNNNSMYEEIVGILKDIENEDMNTSNSNHLNERKKGENKKMNDFNNFSSTKTNSNMIKEDNSRSSTPSSSARAIWSLIENAEKDEVNEFSNSSHTAERVEEIRNLSPKSHHEINKESDSKSWNRLSDLLRLPSSDLAQKVMALQLLLDEKETILQQVNSRCGSQEQQYQQQTLELQNTLQRNEKLLDQLRIEKKTLSDKLNHDLKEIEKKHASYIKTLEDRHKVEITKQLEKQAASDKLEREKWMEMKSQKIKELAIKGLEPELNRMATVHQDEISDIKRFHQRQVQELEEAWNRRMIVLKDKMETDKEKAVAIEREMARQKLDDEVNELEKRYQDQRKRLLAEVHVERENLEREIEATLAIREKENERKWEIKALEMEKKIKALQQTQQDEIQKMQEKFEIDKQIWIKNQTVELTEKENKIREQCKKDRDKHIELVIQKLESDNAEKDRGMEHKMRRLKEQYECDIHDLEMASENLRKKLNESREESQRSEGIITNLRAQLQLLQSEHQSLEEKYERLMKQQNEMQNMAKSELSTKVHILQSELTQAQLTYESQIKTIRSENERELSQMYNRVREMIHKKDEIINTLKRQKEAALQQCNELEKFLDLKRNKLQS